MAMAGGDMYLPASLKNIAVVATEYSFHTPVPPTN